MIPKVLQGTWTEDRLRDLIRRSKYEALPEEPVEELCKLLNALQHPPVERISNITEMPNMGGMMIEFGDGSGVTLIGGPFCKFITEYIQQREQYIAIMEHNRKGDPRVTGEWVRLQEELAQTRSELERLNSEADDRRLT